MKKKIMIFPIVFLVSCLLLFCVKLTGAAVHGMSGAVLTILSAAAMLWSGLLMPVLVKHMVVFLLHKTTALVFCISCSLHVLQHRKVRKEAAHVS